MEPENLRTVVNGVVTAAVSLVPATFLYLQNKRSGERESKERADQRAAENQHRSASELAARAESQERRLAAHRERYLRYSRSAEGISAAIRLRSDGNHFYLPDELRAEAAAAFEDVMLDADQGVREAATYVRSDLDRLVVLASKFNKVPGQNEIESVEAALDAYREACRESLRSEDTSST